MLGGPVSPARRRRPFGASPIVNAASRAGLAAPMPAQPSRSALGGPVGASPDPAAAPGATWYPAGTAWQPPKPPQAVGPMDAPASPLALSLAGLRKRQKPAVSAY